MRLWLVSLILLYLLGDQVLASEINLTKQAEYWFDVESQYSIETIVEQQNSLQWLQSHNSTLNLGFSSKPLWIKVAIDERFENEPALFEIGWPFVDEVSAFWVADGIIHALGKQGDHQPHFQQYLPHRFILYPLPGDAVFKGTLFLRVETSSSLIFPMRLWDPEGFFLKETRQQILMGFFFGLLTIILIYNLGMYFYARDKIYLFYIAYIAFVCIYLGSLTGLGQQYIWGSVVALNDMMLLLGVMGSFIFGSFFVDELLNLKNKNPIAHKFVMLVAGAYALLGVVWVFTSEAFITPIGQVVGIFAPVAAYGLGIMEWRRGNPDARYFTIAWSVLLIGTCIYTLLLAGLIPDNALTRYTQVVGLGVEVGLLSFALGKRFTRERTAAKQATEVALHLASEVNKSHEEKILLQAEANQQLETQVKERTKELQQTLNKLEVANQQLEALSNTDQLTGLKNRRSFDKYYIDEFRRSIRTRQAISIVALDIDNFKSVNDSYGHLVGDECLKKVAEVIQFHAQRPGDMAVRYGGEEFILLLPDTDVKGAGRVSEYIREEVALLPISVENASFSVTISLGVASIIPNDVDQPNELIKNADTALYQAKFNGRNRVEIA